MAPHPASPPSSKILRRDIFRGPSGAFGGGMAIFQVCGLFTRASFQRQGSFASGNSGVRSHIPSKSPMNFVRTDRKSMSTPTEFPIWPDAPYATVTWRRANLAGDGPDEGQNPDWLVKVGQTITLRPSISGPIVYDPFGPDPITFDLLPVTAVVNENGYLTSPHGVPIQVASTNDPLMSHQNWVWTIDGYPNIKFPAPSGESVDLSRYVIFPVNDQTRSWVQRLPELVALIPSLIGIVSIVEDDGDILITKSDSSSTRIPIPNATWASLTDKPATFPPELPVDSSGEELVDGTGSVVAFVDDTEDHGLQILDKGNSNILNLFTNGIWYPGGMGYTPGGIWTGSETLVAPTSSDAPLELATKGWINDNVSAQTTPVWEYLNNLVNWTVGSTEIIMHRVGNRVTLRVAGISYFPVGSPDPYWNPIDVSPPIPTGFRPLAADSGIQFPYGRAATKHPSYGTTFGDLYYNYDNSRFQTSFLGTAHSYETTHNKIYYEASWITNEAFTSGQPGSGWGEL